MQHRTLKVTSEELCRKKEAPGTRGADRKDPKISSFLSVDF
jgi:hypothetical protein